MVWAGLRRKPLRTVLTLLSIMTAFLLYGGMNGTMTGFDRFLDGLADERLLYTLSRSNPGQPLPQGHIERIKRIPGIEHVYGGNSFNGYYQQPTNTFGGTTIPSLGQRSASRRAVIVDDAVLEEMRRTRTGIVVGKQLARRFGWKTGDRVPLHLTTLRKDRTNVWLFDVVGEWDRPPNSGGSADQIWVNFEYYDEARAFDHGTVMSITTRTSDASQADRIAHEIDKLFENSDGETQTQSLAASIRAELNSIVDVQLMISAVLSAVFFALLFVTGNTMMQSVRERIPEFAVLKTCGYRDVTVSGLVLSEALLLCLVGALAGILAAAELLFPLIFAAFRLDPIPMPPQVIALGIAIAIVLAMISGLPPALRAGRLSIVNALSRK
jgi:putative ABC transport system permease protein